MGPSEEYEKKRKLIEEKICVEQIPVLYKILDIYEYWSIPNTEVFDYLDKNKSNFSQVKVKVKDGNIIGLYLNIKNFKDRNLLKEKVVTLFEAIGQLTTLIELKIRDITLLYIPGSIQNLKSLEGLSVSHCALEKIPEYIGKLTKLKWLNLSSNLFVKLPDEIGNLISLEQFDLSVNRYLSSLPESFGQLSKLKALSLNNTDRFSKFPKSMSKLHNLEEITAYLSGLSEIPEEICSLHLMKSLDLSSNKISVIPNCIGNLKSLKKLHLRNNGFRELPETIGDLSNLEELSLYSNKIEKLPENFGKLKNLKSLVLSGNPLVNVPSSFANLKKLESFEIENTYIQELPTKALNKLVELERKYKCTHCKSPTLGITKYCSKCTQKTGISDRIIRKHTKHYVDGLTEEAKKLYFSLDQKQRDGFTVIEHMNTFNEAYSHDIQWLDKDGDPESSSENITVMVDESNVVRLYISRIWNFDMKMFNEALYYFPNLRVLSIVNMPIEFAPENLKQLSNLEELTLEDLMEIPDWFDKLKIPQITLE